MIPPPPHHHHHHHHPKKVGGGEMMKSRRRKKELSSNKIQPKTFIAVSNFSLIVVCAMTIRYVHNRGSKVQSLHGHSWQLKAPLILQSTPPCNQNSTYWSIESSVFNNQRKERGGKEGERERERRKERKTEMQKLFRRIASLNERYWNILVRVFVFGCATNG